VEIKIYNKNKTIDPKINKNYLPSSPDREPSKEITEQPLSPETPPRETSYMSRDGIASSLR